MISINRNPNADELRVFALLLMVFLALLAGLAVQGEWISATAGGVLFVLANIVGLLGLALPRSFRRVYVGWMLLMFPFGWLISHALLAIIFYLVMMPIALVMRLVGYDPLQRKFDRTARTYWTKRAADSDVRRYFRQF